MSLCTEEAPALQLQAVLRPSTPTVTDTPRALGTGFQTHSQTGFYTVLSPP